MVLSCVTNFIQKIDEYDEVFIQDVKCLSGYGIAYAGDGYVGFYKLEIDFSQPMCFVTKIALGQRTQPYVTSFVDYALEYFFKIDN